MQQNPKDIFHHMMKTDAFSKWMGIELVDIAEGSCTLSMQVRPEMLNGFNILHGGVAFSLADSAFAFASNSHGILSVSLEASMTYAKPALAGDLVIAEATERTLTRKTATYDVSLKKEDGTLLYLFRGTVYRTSRPVMGSTDE